MASSLRTFNRRLFSGGKLKFAFTRRFCGKPMSNRSSEQQYLTRVEYLLRSIVTVERCFFGPEDHCSRGGGGGVFIDPTLIVTSAHVVGRVSTAFELKTPQKPDRFEHCSVVHSAEMVTTFAVTRDLRTLKTKPLAVNFGQDIAVLKVVPPPHQAEETYFPQHCSMAKSPPRKGDVVTVSFNQGLVAMGIIDDRWVSVAGNVRAIGEKTVKAKAPWPLDNDSPWIEHDDQLGYRWGADPSTGYSFSRKEEYTGSVAPYTGSPLFNFDGEVVGIGSWVVGGEEMSRPFSLCFAVPLSQIRAVVEYAKTKKPEEPIVMDKWNKR